MDDRVQIAVYSSHSEAQMCQNTLATYEIQSWISSDDGGGIVPGQSMVQGVKVLVLKKDEEKAGYVLGGSAEKKPEPGKWKCPGCGEKIESQFTECWNCGHSREIF